VIASLVTKRERLEEVDARAVKALRFLLALVKRGPIRDVTRPDPGP